MMKIIDASQANASNLFAWGSPFYADPGVTGLCQPLRNFFQVNKTSNFPAADIFNENEAKAFLRKFGIPVVTERIADNPEDAVEAAQEIGFPVVVKGMGSSLMHKTEMGIVHLSLFHPADVEKAARSIANAAGKDLESFLIQPHVSGRREFVAGLIRDPQFGPVIMFGTGGVFTEAFSDVAFRLAPLRESDAVEMLNEIQGKALLGEFRGEKPVRSSELIKALMGLSREKTASQ